MKKNLKRWLALLLSIALIASTGIYSSHSWLRANEDGQTTEDAASQETQQEKQEIEVPPPAEEPAPAPKPEPAPAPEQQTPAPEPVPTPTPAPQAEEPANQTEAPAEQPAQPETPDEQPEVAKYNVVINKPAVDGGNITVWADGVAKKEVKAQYVEEVTEGTVLHIEVTAPENYTVDKVTDNNGAQLAVSGNVYNLTVNGAKEITVTYKEEVKEEQKTEEKKETPEQDSEPVQEEVTQTEQTVQAELTTKAEAVSRVVSVFLAALAPQKATKNIESCIVAFNSNDVRGLYHHKELLYNEEFTFPDLAATGWDERENYKLIGWKKVGENLIYSVGATGIAGEHTYLAVWEDTRESDTIKKELNITFHSNDDRGLNTSEVVKTSSYVFHDFGWSRDGYTLLGWSEKKETDKSTALYAIGERISTAEKKTSFFAVWQSNARHKVTYEWSGLPFLQEGQKFYKADGKTEASFRLPMPITNLGEGDKYTIDSTMPGTKVYLVDEHGNIIAEYTLSAWTDPNNGIMGTKDVVVRAVWTTNTIIPNTWKITYNWDIVAAGGSQLPINAEAYLASKVKLPADVRTYTNNEPYVIKKTTYPEGYTVESKDQYGNVNGHYTFSGWNKENGNITENLDVKGTWTYTEKKLDTHKVTYDWIGLPEGAALYDEAGNITVPELPAEITGLVKGQPYEIDKTNPGTVVYTKDIYGNKTAKYTLSDWNKNDGTMGDSDVKVSAEWKLTESYTPDEYTITFDANGGTGSYTLQTQNQSFTFPDNKASGITREGYEFEGWSSSSTGSVEYTSGQNGTASKDTTYYAVWKKVNPVVTFEPNGGTGNAFTITAIDGAFVYPDNNDYGIVREGYTFIGWSERKDGKGASYIPNVQQKGIQKNTTYYAIWMDEKANGEVKTLFFVRKDGEIKLEPASYPNAQYYNVGTGTLKQAIAINNNLAAVAANIKTAPSDETLQSVIPNYDPSTDKVIWYVIKMEDNGWHVDGVVQKKDLHAVAYYPNGGSTNNVPGAKQYPAGKEVNVEVNTYPSREGYTFIGWDENAQAPLNNVQYPKGQSSSFIMPNKNVNLYAIWSPNEATAYAVEHYLEQSDGTFALGSTSERAGRTGETVNAGAESFTGYIFDSNNENNIKTGVVAADGSLVLKLYYKMSHKVTYTWSGLPDGDLFDKDGNKVTPELPADINNLKSGDTYKLKDANAKVVYIQDIYGNKTAKYTLGAWNDPENGKMQHSDIVVSAVWELTETYEVDTWKITYEWDGDVPAGKYAQVLPTDEKVYPNNDSYTIDTTYPEGYTVTTYDAHNNVNGVYTFSGWDMEAGEHITKNLKVKGTWTFTETTVAQHNVTYEWTGLPTGTTLYDAAGDAVTPNVPESITGLVNNESYTVDRSKEGTVLYTYDQYGNNTGTYTLGTWSDPNNGTMANADVKVTAVWTPALVTVPTWRITYNWTGAPEGTYAKDLPTDATVYKNNQPYTVDTVYSDGTTVTTYDTYGNVNGEYTFSGWNTANGKITENLTIEGTWTFTETTVARHNVSYEWEGIPKEDLFNAEGKPVKPQLPKGITGLVKGQEYTVDTTMPNTVVYTQDEYGNRNGKYTLGTWVDPNNGKMGEADIVVKAAWIPVTLNVPEFEINYKWSGDVPKGDYTQQLPEDKALYKNNQPYKVDKVYANGYTVTTKDEHGNVNGVYTFSGWNTTDGNINGNLTIEGTWTFTKTEVAAYNVNYEWTGLPEGTVLYDEAGNVTVPGVPAGITGLVNNETYTTDRSQENKVVYTHDAYGNNTASYTLGTWNDPNNGVMGEKDVLVTAEWTKSDITVPTYGITYNWTGNVPEGDYAQVLPTDAALYKNNQPYAVDKTFENGYRVTAYDEYGNVNGVYTFSGWNTTDGNITANLTIEGTWAFTETTVAAYNVSYEWTGLPEGTVLYDEAGNEAALSVPASITGLVNGQSYAVDTTMAGTVVYTYDEEGNVNAKYTLGIWADPNSGKMGESDILIKAEWAKEEITVDRLYNLTIHYVDAEGNTVAEDYTGKLAEGEAFTVTSPTVEGFTPDYASVNSGENGMPARDLTFTVVYVANEVVTPGTPGLPGLIPGTPAVVTPGTPTPAAVTPAPGAPLVAVPQAETPLAVEGVVQLEEDGDYTLTQIQDEQTPLANRNLEDHDCCLLHFLLILAAFIVEAVYTRNMKKRQAKIFELREELEMEKQKKEPGENDDAE